MGAGKRCPKAADLQMAGAFAEAALGQREAAIPLPAMKLAECTRLSLDCAAVDRWAAVGVGTAHAVGRWVFRPGERESS